MSRMIERLGVPREHTSQCLLRQNSSPFGSLFGRTSGQRMKIYKKVLASLRNNGLAVTAQRAVLYSLQRMHILEGNLIEARRNSLSRDLFIELGGKVRYGPLRGFKISNSPSWGIGDKAGMLLGIYESDLLQDVMRVPARYRTMIDVGAADGYSGLGLLFNGRFDRSLCFETTEKGRNTLKSVAFENDLLDRVTICGKADFGTLAAALANLADPGECVVIMDIEGSEFDLLQESVLELLRRSIIFVELHERPSSSGRPKSERLIAACGRSHNVTRISGGARDPTLFRELDTYHDNDRWLVCSEGRYYAQEWIRLDPK
jgi:hypothetical protein